MELKIKMSEEQPSEEELKKMLDEAKKAADKKRQEQAAKVGELKGVDTKGLEEVIEKKKNE